MKYLQAALIDIKKFPKKLFQKIREFGFIRIVLLILFFIIAFRILDYNLLKNLAPSTGIIGGKFQGTYLARTIALTITVIMTIYLALVIVMLQTKVTVEKWFLITIIPLSIIYLMLFTPWAAPDTDSHMNAIYRFSNMLMGKSGEDLWTGRAEDAALFADDWKRLYEADPSIENYERVIKNFHAECLNSETVALPLKEKKMTFYSPLSYFPQILGLTLGRILNLSALFSVYLARIFILVFYIIVIFRDIKNIPAGKWIIAIAALLPVSLMMAGSVSYDAMAIISALSFISCVVRLIENNKSKPLYFETMFWAFMLGAVKGGGYLILLPLALLLFDRKNKIRSMIGVSGLITAGLFSVLLFDVLLAPVTGFQFHQKTAENLSFSFAFHEPLKYFDMVMSTYLSQFDELTAGAGGIYMGWLDRVFPVAVMVLFMLVGGIESIFEHDRINLTNIHKAIMICCIIIGLLFTPAMLLRETSADSHIIIGLQGRYFLPILPLVFFVLTKFSLHDPEKNNKEITGKGIMWLSVVLCMFIYYLMTMYLTRSSAVG